MKTAEWRAMDVMRLLILAANELERLPRLVGH